MKKTTTTTNGSLVECIAMGLERLMGRCVVSVDSSKVYVQTRMCLLLTLTTRVTREPCVQSLISWCVRSHLGYRPKNGFRSRTNIHPGHPPGPSSVVCGRKFNKTKLDQNISTHCRRRRRRFEVLSTHNGPRRGPGSPTSPAVLSH